MATVSEDLNTLVVDCGTSWFKCGHAGDEIPSGYFPSLTAERLTGSMTAQDEDLEAGPKPIPHISGLRMEESFYEDYSYRQPWDYSKVAPRLPSDYAVEDGPPPPKAGRDQQSPDFDPNVFKTLLQRGLEQTQSDSFSTKGASILLSDPDINSIDNAKRVTELLFEGLDFASAYLSKRSVLTLFSLGKTSGVPIQFSTAGTSITPVIDGYAMNRSLAWTPLGGDAMDQYLTAALEVSGISPSPANGLMVNAVPGSIVQVRSRHLYHTLKESLLRTATMDPSATKFKNTCASVSRATYYELPDGTTLDAHDPACVLVPELFFNPSVIQELKIDAIPSFEVKHALPDLVRRAVLSAEADSRKALVSSFSLHGGSSKIPGLQGRFAKSMYNDSVLGRVNKPRVHAATKYDRGFSTFLGGSILGSLSSFKQMWISRAEYEEYGDAVVCMRLM